MSANKLQNFLKSTAGDEEIEFLVPHPFLPPRYREESKQRNMIVMLDRDMTVHLRWENSRMGTWSNIAKSEFSRLMREVLRKMTQYRADTKIFSAFVSKVAEAPFDDPIYDESIPSDTPPYQAIREEGNAKEGVNKIPHLYQDEEEGGESPLLSMEW